MPPCVHYPHVVVVVVGHICRSITRQLLSVNCHICHLSSVICQLMLTGFMTLVLACAIQMRTDYNQKHFVRNEQFKAAAEKLSGPTRKIFIEFLERSCTAEFSGFLLFKELARRLKDVNPTVAGKKYAHSAAPRGLQCCPAVCCSSMLCRMPAVMTACV